MNKGRLKIEPTSWGVHIDYSYLRGNGRIFACREIARRAKALRLDCEVGAGMSSMSVYIHTRRAARRCEELEKYLCGKQFQRRILNNGWWDTCWEED